jgi:hypothetical protein
MSSATYFSINQPDVVSETIDGESVIINLYKGLYYNLNPSGSEIWTLIEAGANVTDIATVLSQKYPAAVDVLSAVEQLVNELQTEELIVPTTIASGFVAPAAIAADGATFEQPVLYKYADMQDLLALDPIHDVDETGWPNQKAGAVAQA